MAVSQNSKLVTVFGGSGFVGRHVVRALVARGWRVRVAVRRPDLAFFLQPIGAVGQIHAVQANLRYPESIERALVGADAVVNSVGILVPSGKQTFEALVAEGAKQIAEAAARAGITNVAHISAIGADAESAAGYGRAKAAGEAGVLAAVPGATILRPSIVFGPEDDFFNRFASMATMSPVIPLIGGGTKFQPVFVGDVAEAVAMALEGKTEPGGVYELGGPEVKTFRECIEVMLEVIDRKRAIVSLPLRIASMQAWLLEKLPKPMLTRDQVRMLARDNVVSEEAKAAGRTLEGLGIEGRTLEAILPTYLTRFRPRGQFNMPRTA
ncbi:NADH dehydrogenase [Rhodobium orientis]|uniref:Complex I NDUFA9 subunit family protein n=1 Tax=Rhodobium orientis TaxID=34017 RepID=A0A327JQQ1_9HYPH|nr:complex I NDUFA9 subunit family protein [Rhodobium orientis]MBB4303452.1 NADH dehydrogenase [Rhodobium orientis]MBK5950386.1 complex I NDUFA9 subunit family protein [Rhodobium orientis]RAI28381.1 complex I NDUFA9 subunit family protein [Rhodobium orientis]